MGAHANRSRTLLGVGALAGVSLLLVGCGSRPAPADWRIAFPAEHDGDWGMFVVGPRGGGPVRVAAAEAPLWSSAVASPDGRALIVPGHGTSLLMTLDGRVRKTLASAPYGAAAWSPDSKWYAFSNQDTGFSVVRADGTDEHRLTHALSDTSPAWSPDGKSLAFTRAISSDTAGSGLMVVDADGRHLRRVRPLREEIYDIHWARDGRSIVLLEDAGLVTVAVADGHVVRRVPAKSLSGPLAWGPDGRVAYGTSRGSIFLMDADGTSRHFLAHGYQPVWEPDGRALAYLTKSYDIASIRPDGTGMRRLTSAYPNGFSALSPVWIRGPITPAPLPHPIVASPRRDGAVLHTYFPVARLAAAGTRVALVSPEHMYVPNWISTPPLVLWDAGSGRVERVTLSWCQQPDSLAMLDDRVAYDCPFGHAAIYGETILAFQPGRARPTQLADGVTGDGAPTGPLPGSLAGSGGLLVFSITRERSGTAVAPTQLWRVDGTRRRRIASEPAGSEPVAADGARIALELPDGQVELLTREGRLLGRVAPGGETTDRRLAPPSVGLSGRDLVVLRDGRLSDYETTSLRLVQSWRVGRRAQLAGVANGLVAYVTGVDVHILRLRDGRSTTIRTPSRSPVRAALTSAGLFYVLHARPVPATPSMLIDHRPRRNPATVVYVRRAAIIGRLD